MAEVEDEEDEEEVMEEEEMVEKEEVEEEGEEEVMKTRAEAYTPTRSIVVMDRTTRWDLWQKKVAENIAIRIQK